MSNANRKYLVKYENILKAQNKSFTTVTGLLKIIKVFINSIDGKDINKLQNVDVQDWQIKLMNDGKKPSTVTRYSRVVQHFLRLIGAEINITYPRFKDSRQIYFLDLSQVKVIYECLDDSREKALVSLFLETGLKTSELINLRKRNIVEHSLIISPQPPYRILNLSETAQYYLVEYINSKKFLKEGDYIFSTGLNSSQSRLSYASINFIFKNITKRFSDVINIPYVITPRILRNTFIYLQLVKGVPIALIKTQLGLKNDYAIRKIKESVGGHPNVRGEVLISCLKCGSQILPHMKICPYCYSDLPNFICSNCHNPVRIDFKYCPYCSTALNRHS